MTAAGPCRCGTGLPAICCCEAAPPAAALPHPEEINGLLGRARAAAARGDFHEAQALCKECIGRDARNLAAIALLAGIHREEKRLPVAVALMRRFVALQPADPKARADLAILLLEADDAPAADVEARACLRLSPDQSLGHRLVATTSARRFRPEFGEWHCREALRLDGPGPAIHALLAANLAAQGKLQEARDFFHLACAAPDASVAAFLGLARLETTDGNFDAAAGALDAAQGLDPLDQDVLLARGRLLGRMNREEEAIAVLGRVSGVNVRALFETGRLQDRLGRHDDAMATFGRARDALRGQGHGYRAEAAQARVASLAAFFTAPRMALLPRARAAEGRPQPIFIMGFPRSGTTLVEQILSSHSRIDAGDELPLVNDLAASAPRLLNAPLPYPGALTELWMGDRLHALDTMRDEYLLRAAQRGVSCDGEPWFTDKMPLNELNLGFICMLFPDSPRIRLVRHPLDVVVSVYSHWMGFADGFDMSLADAARHYLLVEGLMERYRAQLGEQYVSVRYEDLVADPEAHTRRMLDLVGVDFEESCLRFEQNRRRARTPSSMAVRRRVYDTSVFRYRRYLPHLDEAAAILQPVMDRLGYRV